ncbi:vitamin D3 hydroxylase-associated protein-like isoform X1 [Hyla sarda]|uniref:vitamin D3 hydroxylase-associated protein-like isoform X1 n=1 Tax=Hyla sarda TaxID=327740 RepID=UPI0024C3AE7A|nr:vitamin D3 hydroxylase-associated protein-like isoform X1 [Hyla sarda]
MFCAVGIVCYRNYNTQHSRLSVSECLSCRERHQPSILWGPQEVFSGSRPLRVGYYETDGSTMATPSMSRAVRQTRDLLQKAGHQLVPFTPPSLESALFGLVMRGLLADRGATFLDNFKGDEVDPNLRTQVTTYSCPSWLKSLLSMLVRPLFPRLSMVLETTQGIR